MKIKFEFDKSEKDAVDHFMSWLCEQGEQDYWTWMEYREQEDDGQITLRNFDYDWKSLSVSCDVGRMSEEEE